MAFVPAWGRLTTSAPLDHAVRIDAEAGLADGDAS